MNFIKMVSSVLVTGTLLAGCFGGDDTSAMVKSHVEAWAKGDIAGAMKDLSVGLSKDVIEIRDGCSTDKIKSKLGRRGIKTKVNETMNAYMTKINKKVEEIKTDGEDFQKLSLEKKIAIFEDVLDEDDKIGKIIIENVKKMFDKKLSRQAERKAEIEMEQKITEVIIKSDEDYEKFANECNMKIYSIKNFEKVNIIESDNDNENPDEKTVRTEIVFKDGKSKKYNTELEMIDGDWKIIKTYPLEKVITDMLFSGLKF